MKADIFFDEQEHLYLVNGVEVPSVTELLAPLHKSYLKVNPSILEYAANRGKAVHSALESYDLGCELEATPETAPYLQAYLDWAQVYKPTWVAVEKIVYNGDFCYGDYIGTVDRIGYFNGGKKLNVVDIKTSQATRESITSACLQTYAYAAAYTKDEADRWVLFLKSDGTWRFQSCEEYEKKNGIIAWDCFGLLLRTRKMVDDLLRTGKRITKGGVKNDSTDGL